MNSDEIASLSPTGRALILMRENILKDWEQRVRSEVKEARYLLRPLLINTIPAFIESLAKALSPELGRNSSSDFNTIAGEHGDERARVTYYDLESLIREYQALKEAILLALSQKVGLSREEELIIRHSTDAAMRESATSFALAQAVLREQFVATVTHDLRSPLSVITMAAELARNELHEPEKITSLLDRIVSNAERADRLIQNLLDAALLRSGARVKLQLAACEIRHLVEDTVSQLSLVHGPRFQVTGPTVYGIWDPAALRRALENLCSNAIKYGSSDTPVRISIKRAQDRLAIEVHNEGTPIPAEEQEAIFQVYRRATAAKESSQDGWGLGLALVRGVAEAHGGNIGLESQEGHGSTFKIDIPIDSRT